MNNHSIPKKGDRFLHEDHQGRLANVISYNRDELVIFVDGSRHIYHITPKNFKLVGEGATHCIFTHTNAKNAKKVTKKEASEKENPVAERLEATSSRETTSPSPPAEPEAGSCVEDTVSSNQLDHINEELAADCNLKYEKDAPSPKKPPPSPEKKHSSTTINIGHIHSNYKATPNTRPAGATLELPSSNSPSWHNYFLNLESQQPELGVIQQYNPESPPNLITTTGSINLCTLEQLYACEWLNTHLYIYIPDDQLDCWQDT